MKRLLLVACVLASSFCLPRSTVLADISLEVDNVTTLAGATVFLGIQGSSTMGESLAGADIPLDIGGDGIGVSPTGLTFIGFTSAFDSDSSGGGLPAEDALTGGFNFGGAVGLPAEVVTLEFLVDASVAPGTVFDINILNNSSLGVTDQNFIPSQPTLVNNGVGTIRVAAVPEPSSLLVILLAVGGLSIRRIRK